MKEKIKNFGKRIKKTLRRWRIYLRAFFKVSKRRLPGDTVRLGKFAIKERYAIAALGCGVVAICILIGMALHNYHVKQRQDAYEALLLSATIMETPMPDPPMPDPPMPPIAVATEEPPVEEVVDLSVYGISEKNLDFTVLYEENEDIYAWITIPDTNIDYPVLQHPEELDYYLEYNMDGSKGYPGCIYSQYLNAKDFSDFNTVFYGHNMKAGTMFANLHKFEDETFFEEHPYVYIYTEEGPLVYQVFASYVFTDAHILYSFDTSTEVGKQEYIDQIYEREGADPRNHFRTEVEVTPESHILTLSTCISGESTNRYLVACVLVADGRGQVER